MVFRTGHHPWNDFDRRENLREVNSVLTDAADASLCAGSDRYSATQASTTRGWVVPTFETK